MLSKTAGLYWYTNDLRVADNCLLARAVDQVDTLHCVFCNPSLTSFLKHYSREEHFGCAKQVFLEQSIDALSSALTQHNLTLQIESKPALVFLTDLIEKLEITHLFCNQSAGSDEQKTLVQLRQKFPAIQVVQQPVNTLFNLQQLPFDVSEIPVTFTKFRKQVESLSIEPVVGINSEHDNCPFQRVVGEDELVFCGGESTGQEHIEDYFAASLASEYKKTRNGLDGMLFSTKFSPWLALGCISPRLIVSKLRDYERRNGANDSTYWIYFELLWREYFYWHGRQQGKQLFFDGSKVGDTRMSRRDIEVFDSWKQGMTGYPIVDACMNQLSLSGYMSNRGRQLAASCLIYELDLDWRMGAAYFETQLIDYDVSSNWGNWQYIAGIGAAPNTTRQFDLEYQTQLYDPNGDFIAKWIGLSCKGGNSEV